MPIDPRFFLGLTGPVPAQQMLPPGFRPPGPGGGAPMAGPQGMPMGGIPGFSMPKLAGGPGMKPSTSGAEMGAAENDGLGNSIAKIQALQPGAHGTFAPPPMPTDVGSGQGGGSFLDWLSKIKTGLF